MHALTMIMITFNPTERRSTLTPLSPLTQGTQNDDVDVTKCSSDNVQGDRAAAGMASDIVSTPPQALAQ